MKKKTITLVRVVQTSFANPSTWDAWDGEGQYYYLRYQGHEGSMEAQPSPDPDTWTLQTDEEMAGWFVADAHFRDVISLTSFVMLMPNVELASDAKVVMVK